MSELSALGAIDRSLDRSVGRSIGRVSAPNRYSIACHTIPSNGWRLCEMWCVTNSSFLTMSDLYQSTYPEFWLDEMSISRHFPLPNLKQGGKEGWREGGSKGTAVASSSVKPWQWLWQLIDGRYHVHVSEGPDYHSGTD